MLEQAKRCRNCNTEKALTDFHNKKDSEDGKTTYCKACKKTYDKKKRNTKESYEKRRWINLMQRYGISKEDYTEMFTKQKASCAICGIHQLELKRPLVVDHCHNSMTVRGLLCDNCNNGIGKLKESVDVLNSAISYLKAFEE